jgi:hypothetical protein
MKKKNLYHFLSLSFFLVETSLSLGAIEFGIKLKSYQIIRNQIKKI